ncbi:cytosolic protein [Cytobacillus suaedae]|nr:cytosolic protein [Cytobacillus suaedae]
MGSLQSFFSNHCETSDKHRDPVLKSHYYKVTNKQAIQSVKDFINKQNGFTLTSISEERGEMSVSVAKKRKAFMVITVISVRPFETAIDFSVTTETSVLPMDFGYSKRLVQFMYKELDGILPLLNR